MPAIISPGSHVLLCSPVFRNFAGEVLLGCCDDVVEVGRFFEAEILSMAPERVQPSIELLVGPILLVIGEGVLGLARLHFKTLRATHLLLKWLHSRLWPLNLLLCNW